MTMPGHLSMSAADKDGFDRDGVICLRNILNEEEVGKLRTAVARQLASLGQSATGYDFEALAKQVWELDRDVDTGAADRFDMHALKALVRSDAEARSLLEDEMPGGKGLFFYDAAAWKRDRGMREVAFDSRLPEIVADLLQTGYLNFWEDTTFVKAPHTRQKTAFHQDLAYFQIAGDQCVIVWIPLDAATRESGVVQYVRGSHTWGEVYAPNVFVSQTPIGSSPEKRCPDIEAHPDKYDIVSFDVDPGDVIIHHVRTVHGAGGNRTDSWRRAMSFRYCGDKIRYFDRPGALKQMDVAGDLANGARLFSRDYPIVWPKPWPGLNLAALYK